MSQYSPDFRHSHKRPKPDSDPFNVDDIGGIDEGDELLTDSIIDSIPDSQIEGNLPGDPLATDFDVHCAYAVLSLNTIQERYLTVKDQMEKVKWKQKQLSFPPQLAAYTAVDNHLKELLYQVQTALIELNKLHDSFILQPSELKKVYFYRRELISQEHQLQLFQLELQSLAAAETDKCFVSLFITKQPFPKAVKKESKTSGPFEDPLIVTLFRAPRTELQQISKAKASLIHEEYSAKHSSFTLICDTQEFDSQGDAPFQDLRFSQGTRLKMVRLQFGVQVQFLLSNGSISTLFFESNPSSPFVVLTNENQWDASAGALLKKDAFDMCQEIPWQRFANTLQLHYLRATRQDLEKPTRVLSRYDLHYIFVAKFGWKTMINQKQYEEFWDWFGKALHKIRHQKHFYSLWLRGYIYGFVSKSDAEAVLQNQPAGAFILRFSDRRPGKLAVAYLKRDLRTGAVEIKHYMIDNDKKDNKTLLEFLATHQNLLYWVQSRTDFSPGPNRIHSTCEKHVILRDYLAKPENSGSKSGDDDGYADVCD